MDLGPFALRGAPPACDGVADAYAPRRKVLDTILVDAAVQAGAELREHFTVSELLMEGERVTGIRGHSSGGATVRRLPTTSSTVTSVSCQCTSSRGSLQALPHLPLRCSNSSPP
jgi:hypothetical protein